jgi:hypothetical protein
MFQLNRRTILHGLVALLPTCWLRPSTQKPTAPPDFYPHLDGETYEEKLQAALSLTWGTYGKHQEFFPHHKVVSLGNCGNDHLLAILSTQHQISQTYCDAIRLILNARATGRIRNLLETIVS